MPGCRPSLVLWQGLEGEHMCRRIVWLNKGAAQCCLDSGVCKLLAGQAACGACTLLNLS